MLPTPDGLPQRVHSRHEASLNHEEDSASEEGFGDDFDEFEESAQPGDDDDFGDFGDGVDGLSAAEALSKPLLAAHDEPEPNLVSRGSCISSLMTPIFGGSLFATLLIL